MNISRDIFIWGVFSLALLLVSCSEQMDRNGTESTTERSATKQLADTQLSTLYDPAHYDTLVHNSTPLNGGTASAKALVAAALKGLQNNDTALLMSLLISQDEYFNIIYPEQGMHWAGARDKRPEVREFLWENHAGSSIKGLRRALRDLGGQKLTLNNIEFTDGTKQYISYRIHEGTVLTLVDESSNTHTTQAVGSIVEKDGVFKLMAWRDLD